MEQFSAFMLYVSFASYTYTANIGGGGVRGGITPPPFLMHGPIYYIPDPLLTYGHSRESTTH